MGLSAEIIEVEEACDRHPNLDILCDRLQAVMHGRAAEELLAHRESIPDRAGVAALPAWTWLRPLINVGRKDKAFGTGESLLMPIRNDWDTPMVVLVTESGLPVTYRSRGMGHTMAGQSRVVCRAGGSPVAMVKDVPSLSAMVFVGTAPRAQVIRSLEAIASAGKEALWEVLQSLEPKLRKELYKAHAYVSHEIAETSGAFQPMLDEISIDEIQDFMMFGDDKKPGSVFRLIELCLAPECFLRVDPLKYMSKHLRRDAETQIRRKIGDPHIGPKIREIARNLPDGNRDLARIVSEYRKVYPKDRLSINRAEAAMTVSPDAMARATVLMPETMDFSRGRGQ
ncbi:hypothetical protein [Arthrobacter sp. zg-Y1110]|uniref:hypothetical protein n=1 Tax=Arthrobacter sp. zg-Y1110 TaxID=2886932 RepID=UPI001D13CB07|nr:hypothetical protein [Arthrobacter sp. zg-Y1110]MCC3292855.1 hypothetical protein [Arthrobacter sp. zg-Y1110]UWX86794.1 hypothetical protein N2K99_18295 [Arthrobacter sp. zg-Y1110]